jgi:sarcosine oxidase subunit delta
LVLFFKKEHPSFLSVSLNMRLLCPFCGERGLEEFTYAGDAALVRPAPDAGQAEWVEYVYMRRNPAGVHGELWYHGVACRQFVKLERDTRTHAILSSSAV